jgi:ethanolamine utilization protein EutQ (cupin superfamily)
MSSTLPVIVDTATAAEVRVGPDGNEGTIKRLVGRDHGSSVLFGHFRLDPGQRGSFTLPHATGMQQEIYYLLEGRLQVSCGTEQVVAGPGQTVLFPGGADYHIETLGSEAVQLVWTGFPAP